jgi:hypothetical protein
MIIWCRRLSRTIMSLWDRGSGDGRRRERGEGKRGGEKAYM